MSVRSRARVVGGLIGALACFASAVAGAEASFPGKNGRIGYSIYEDLNDEDSDYVMATVRPDGSHKRVLDMNDWVEGLAFSPTGNRIAFSSSHYTEPAIFTSGPFGRDRRRLTGPGVYDFNPAWSPTGREVVFTRRRNGNEIWIGGRSGERLLTQGREPSWSVRGDVAYEERGAINVIRPDGTGLRQVARRGSEPDWSPDGTRLVFEVGGDIVQMRLGGSHLRRVTQGRAADSSPAFSPDGKRIVFVRKHIVFVRNASMLVTISTRGRDPRTVAKSSTRETFSDPDWQPRPTS